MTVLGGSLIAPWLATGCLESSTSKVPGLTARWMNVYRSIVVPLNQTKVVRCRCRLNGQQRSYCWLVHVYLLTLLLIDSTRKSLEPFLRIHFLRIILFCCRLRIVFTLISSTLTSLFSLLNFCFTYIPNFLSFFLLMLYMYVNFCILGGVAILNFVMGVFG